MKSDAYVGYRYLISRREMCGRHGRWVTRVPRSCSFGRVVRGDQWQSLVDWTAFTLVGAVFIGTVLHHWYGFLER